MAIDVVKGFVGTSRRNVVEANTVVSILCGVVKAGFNQPADIVVIVFLGKTYPSILWIHFKVKREKL